MFNGDAALQTHVKKMETDCGTPADLPKKTLTRW